MSTKYFLRPNVRSPWIVSPPDVDLGLVVVIPALNEPDLLGALQSLLECDPPSCGIEVIVVINHRHDAPASVVAQNEQSRREATVWALDHSREGLQFHVIYLPDMPHKTGGVGLARKTGMDEAARRLYTSGNVAGVIATYDADCRCASNYMVELEHAFRTNSIDGVSVHFEHRFDGLDASSKQAIVQYESHLRYFIGAQRWAGHPHAFQTIGSSMAVRASAYTAVGGMNTRRAGEDFYFIHKFTARNHFKDLVSTVVQPSGRRSDRVPFGTGKAVNDLLDGEAALTYNPQAFVDLKEFLASVDTLYRIAPRPVLENLPESIKGYLISTNFEEALAEIRSNVAGEEAFRKRFFQWFNAFRLMKYVHFARDHYYPNVPIAEALDWLFDHHFNLALPQDEERRLMLMRQFDRQNAW